MFRTSLLGTVAVVALAAASATAWAADFVMPVLVAPVMVAPAVVPAGPVYRVTVETYVQRYPTSIYVGTVFAADVRLASGWGAKIEVTGELNVIASPLAGNGSVLGRVYRTFGNGTVGAFAQTSAFFPGGSPDLTLGVDADYKSDTADILYAIAVGLPDRSVISIFDGAFDVRERISVDTTVVLGWTGMGFFGLGATQVGYAIGPLTPYVGVVAISLGGGAGVGGFVGVDVEHEVGDGALTLLGGVQLAALGEFGLGFDLQLSANAGFEYKLGGEGPLTIRGNVDYDFSGNLVARLGIGLEFGPGRITGFGTTRLGEAFDL